VASFVAVKEAGPPGSTKSNTAVSTASTRTNARHVDAMSTTRTTRPRTSAHSSAPTLLFDDEFNGTSLDTRKWAKGWLASGITPPINSSENDCYDPKQVKVADGELDLTLIAKPETCGGRRRAFASGIVNSDATFRFTHGYAEARIWLPAGSGLGPGWWTDGQTWPNDGEVDVMQAYNTRSNIEYHYRYGGCGGNCAPGGHVRVMGSTSGWHTYAVNWQSGSMTWYYDGKPVWSFTGSAVTSSPQYLTLNLATYSTSVTVPAVMRVDYVRVYASKP
jgi:beta-glucanase (GH16 family)